VPEARAARVVLPVPGSPLIMTSTGRPLDMPMLGGYWLTLDLFAGQARGHWDRSPSLKTPRRRATWSRSSASGTGTGSHGFNGMFGDGSSRYRGTMCV
jgi:hypothetical protein